MEIKIIYLLLSNIIGHTFQIGSSSSYFTNFKNNFDSYDYHVAIVYDKYIIIYSSSLPLTLYNTNGRNYLVSSEQVTVDEYDAYYNNDYSFNFDRYRSSLTLSLSDLGYYVVSNNKESDNILLFYSNYTILDETTGEVVFREAGSSNNGWSSSGGNDSSNTSNTVSGGGNTNIVTNSTSNNGGNSSGSGSSSESDEDHGWLGNILNTIFGGFIDGTLGTLGRIFTGIGNILTNIIDIFTKVDGIFGFLNPNSENFIFNQLWTHLQNILIGLGNLVSFVLNFFSNLLDFVLHLVVPTDSQWQEIKSNFQGLFTTIENHVPFWTFIRTTITDAQNTNIVPNDFLIIKVPRVQAFGLFQGIDTEIQYINVLQAYEPYRVQIRGLLYLIVVGSAFVVLVKMVTDYRATSQGFSDSDNINKFKK